MPRRRVYSPTTEIRYEGKLQEVFEARLGSPELARQAAALARGYWARRFGLYKETADAVLEKYAHRIPRPLRGLYRAAVFRMVKARLKGEPVDLIVEYFARNGLDRALLEELAREVYPQCGRQDA